jgi:uncharacterized membrane protein (UPF0127 family)
MTYSIDVLFLDHENRVVRLAVEVPPGRLYVGCRGATHVLEMRASAAFAVGIHEGMVLHQL